MSEASFENLISAYLDNELSAEERTRAERLIADDSSAAELFESLREQKSRLNKLPRYKLDGGFADRLLGSAAFENAVAEKAASPVVRGNHSSAGSSSAGSTASHSTEIGRSMKWKAAAAAIGSLAAMIFVTLTVDPSAMMSSTEVTMATRSADDGPVSAIADAMDDSFEREDDEAKNDAGIQMKTGEAGAKQQAASKAEAFRPGELTVNTDGMKKSKNQKYENDAKAVPQKGGAYRGLKEPRQRVQRQVVGGDEKQKEAMPELGAMAENSAKDGDGDSADEVLGLDDLQESPAGDSLAVKDVEKDEFATMDFADKQPAKKLSSLQKKSGKLSEPKSQAKVAGQDANQDANQDAIVGGEQILEIVLPGSDASGTYSIAEFQRALKNNGIAFESKQSGAPSDSKAGLIQNQAIHLVAKPENMKGLLTELAVNRARISSYGFAGNEDRKKLAVASEMPKRASIQSGQLGMRQSRSLGGAGFGGGGGSAGAGGAIAGGGIASSPVPESGDRALAETVPFGAMPGAAAPEGQGMFGAQGGTGGRGGGGRASSNLAAISQQIDAAIGLNQQSQTQLPRRYFLLIRVANPGGQPPALTPSIQPQR